MPKPGLAEYTVAISNAHKLQTKDQNIERKQILAQLEEQNKRLQNAREIAADKDLDLEDFRIIKAECAKNTD